MFTESQSLEASSFSASWQISRKERLGADPEFEISDTSVLMLGQMPASNKMCKHRKGRYVLGDWGRQGRE